MAEHQKYHIRPKNLIPVEKAYVDPLFYRLVSLCTPYGTEEYVIDVIQKYITKQSSYILEKNLVVLVGEKPTTLFSAHMDIVGDISKVNKGLNTIDLIEILEPENEPEYFFGSKRMMTMSGDTIEYLPSTLGADDKVGCYILCKMIEKKIPGLYIFHVGEEKGGIGSRALADKHKDLFEGVERAIAYDRAGYTDIIGKQRFKTCCSKEFMDALAKDLNQYTPPLMKFKTDITGSFTDTASYMEIIPECTNISAGYFDQHGSTEHMDYAWLRDTLLPAALKVKYDELPTERDPKKTETTTYYHYGNSWSNVAWRNQYAAEVAWKDAKLDTPYYQLPTYVYEEGFVSDADPIVFRNFLSDKIKKSTYTDAQKEALGRDIFNMLEYTHILEEEVAALELQIAIMSGEIEIEDNAVPFNDDIIIPPKKKLLLPSPSIIHTGPDMYIFDKKHILESLAGMCKSTNFTDDKLNSSAKKYAEGAMKFLDKNKDKNTKDQFSRNNIKKVNRMIFNMAYWLQCKGSLTSLDREFMNTVADYIKEHENEKGWLSTNLYLADSNAP